MVPSSKEAVFGATQLSGRAGQGGGRPEAHPRSQSTSLRQHPAIPASVPGETSHTSRVTSFPSPKADLGGPSSGFSPPDCPPKGALHPGPKYCIWYMPPPMLRAPGTSSPWDTWGAVESLNLQTGPENAPLVSPESATETNSPPSVFANEVLLEHRHPMPVCRASGCSWLPLLSWASACKADKMPYLALSGKFAEP